MLLGVDTGGTFTDFVLIAAQRIRIHKVLSTPAAPEQAIWQGVQEMGLEESARNGNLTLIHGTTVATNAALEGKGVETVFITNRGLADMLSLGRQTRSELYNLTPPHNPIPVPASHCLEVNARLDAQGHEIEPLHPDDLTQLQQAIATLKPTAVAINLLYSFLDDSQERAIEAALPEHCFISRSSFVLPEYKEYERGMATWLNAWLGPLVQHYLKRLQALIEPSPLAVMQSSGGTIDANQASQRAVNLLLSGPAGGLAAAQFIGRQRQEPQLITFDMGGTSTDVALIDGAIKLTNEGRLGPYPVAVPMVDMHTIGAGGGSIAYIDGGGLLQVGPESAGASPGPACYGQGGLRPTVTDANCVLGFLQANAFLGGRMQLDVDAARRAVATLATPLERSIEETAQGILTIANEHMTRALRTISVQKGYDPGPFRLCCFGGAGGLHVCALAEALRMDKAIVPIHGGVLSAMGMLVAPKERIKTRTLQQPLQQLDPQTLLAQCEQLAQQGTAELLAEGLEADSITTEYSLDMRYTGQSYTLNIPWSDSRGIETSFHQHHQRRYGHALSHGIEIVNIRVTCRAPGHDVPVADHRAETAPTTRTARLFGIEDDAPVLARTALEVGYRATGPLLITENIATTWVAPGWQLEVDVMGNLVLQRL